MQLLLELHIKITLNQFKTLRILLLFVAELTTTDLNIGNFFGTTGEASSIYWHNHGNSGANHLIFKDDIRRIRNQTNSAMNSIVKSITQWITPLLASHSLSRPFTP